MVYQPEHMERLPITLISGLSVLLYHIPQVK